MGQVFEFMKKMVQGKPVFDDTNTQSNNPLEQPSPAPTSTTDTVRDSSIVKHQDETFPVIEVRRVKAHLDGENIQVYCQIQNTWHEQIMLDKIRVFDMTRELDTYLNAGDVRDFLVYKGPKFRSEYHEATIDYRTARERDYFQAEYYVKYTYNQADGSYIVTDMELDPPIRDIHEG